jgi:uncharacterized protein
MLKLILFVAVVVTALWLFKSRARSSTDAPPQRPPPPAGQKPQPMLACAHCGVHLPQADVLTDADGRPYCTEAHRLAGPR